MQEFPKKLNQKLIGRESTNTLRYLPEGNGLIDFSSNDYLGFAKNETIYSKTFQLLLKKGVNQNGATGSRLLSGNHYFYNQLEHYLEDFYKAEGALVFNSGYDANIGFFASVPQRGDIILYDELIHASIRDGVRMSDAKNYKFKHNDLDSLKSKIELLAGAESRMQDSVIYVVTESVFSMDGDSPDLPEIVEICDTYGCFLVIDEAHATGVFGRNGIGLVQEQKFQNRIFARIITFGKALGSHGAVILGSSKLKEYLINFARSFIYTTGLSPHCVATVLSAYSYMKDNKSEEQKQLQKNIKFFRQKIKQLELEGHFILSNSAIHSCIIPENEKVKSVSIKLKDNGFDVKPILSPTVPNGEERLRFCLHSYNSKEEMGLVLELLASYL